MARVSEYVRPILVIQTNIKIKQEPDLSETWEESTDSKINKTDETAPSNGTPNANSRKKTRAKGVKVQNKSVCTICMAYFKNDFSLQAHIRVWSAKHSCDRCNATFCTQGLQLHQKRGCYIKSNAPYNFLFCNFCNAELKLKTSLQSHLFHVHGDLIRSGKNGDEDCSKLNSTSVDTSDVPSERRNNLRSAKMLNGSHSSKRRNNDSSNRIKDIANFAVQKCVEEEKPINQHNMSDQTLIFTGRNETCVTAQPRNTPIVNTLDDTTAKAQSESTFSYKGSYHLRRAKTTSYSWLFHSEPTFNKTAQVSCKRKAEPISGRNKKQHLLDECKECVVLLKRCDSIVNNIKTSKNTSFQEILSNANSGQLALSGKYVDAYKYRCCEKMFPSKKKIKKHIKAVDLISNNYTARYRLKKMLLQHYMHRHTISFEKIKCCVCCEELNSAIALKRHMIQHYGRSAEKSHLLVNARMKINIIKKVYHCRGCYKRFWLRSRLEQHGKVCRHRINMLNDQQIDPVEKYSASAVESLEEGTRKVFVENSDSSKLKKKNESEENIDTFAKKLCTTKTKQPLIVKNVFAKRSSQANFHCPFCTQCKNLRRKCSNQSLLKQWKIRCNICHRPFPSREMLESHMSATHKYKYFHKTCNQDVQIHHVDTNVTSVTNVSNFICNVCGLAFQLYDRFAEHTMYYYKGQAFDCSVCGESFQGMYQLHRHNKLEHYPVNLRDLYIYKCDICKDGFNHKSHLHAHTMHVHSGVMMDDVIRHDHTYALPANIDTVSENVVSVSMRSYMYDVCRSIEQSTVNPPITRFPFNNVPPT